MIVRGKRKIPTFLKRAIASKFSGMAKITLLLFRQNFKFPEDERTDKNFYSAA